MFSQIGASWELRLTTKWGFNLMHLGSNHFEHTVYTQ